MFPLVFLVGFFMGGGVVLGRFAGMVQRVQVMAMRQMGVMRSGLVVTGFVLGRRVVVLFGGLGVVVGGLAVMLGREMVGHGVSLRR